MVTITAEAIANVKRWIANVEQDPTNANSPPVDWFVIISWGKGAADNRRTADGAVAWSVAPDEGWVAEIGGWTTGKVPREEGTSLFGDVRLLVQNRFAPAPFQGGEIYVEGANLKVRGHAI